MRGSLSMVLAMMLVWVGDVGSGHDKHADHVADVSIFNSLKFHSFGFINSYDLWIVTSLLSHEIKRSRCFKEKLI